MLAATGSSAAAGSALPAARSALTAWLWAIRYSHGRRSRTSVPDSSACHARTKVACRTSSASGSLNSRRRYRDSGFR